MDLKHGPDHDLSTVSGTHLLCGCSEVGPSLFMVAFLRTGFCKGVLNVLRCLPDAVLVMGPPCSSFSFMNVATSLRSRTRPLGDETKGYVEMGSLFLDKDILEATF